MSCTSTGHASQKSSLAPVRFTSVILRIVATRLFSTDITMSNREQAFSISNNGSLVSSACLVLPSSAAATARTGAGTINFTERAQKMAGTAGKG